MSKELQTFDYGEVDRLLTDLSYINTYTIIDEADHSLVNDVVEFLIKLRDNIDDPNI